VQQAESLVPRIRHQGSVRDDGGAQGQEASVHAGGAAGQPANQGRTPVWERILDTRGQACTATPATSSTLAERVTQRYGRRQATTPGGAVATTAARTVHRRRNPRGPVCSAGRSARRASPRPSASPPRSTNTRGRRNLVYGSTTTAWRASWGCHHRRSNHPQPAAAPRRFGPDVARAPAAQPDQQLG
jgi:hypothetical protein